MSQETQKIDAWMDRLRGRIKKGVKPTPAENLPYKIVEKRTLTYLEASNHIARNMQSALIKQGHQGKLHFHPDNLPVLDRIINNILEENPKGVFLYGNNSAGKSFALIETIKTINRLAYSGYYHNATSFRVYDYEYLMQACQQAKGLSPLYKIEGNIVLDDLGYGGFSEINIMGTKLDFVTKVVYHLHKHFKAGNKVFFTSNLTMPYIIDNYGKGTHDRIMEMCHVEKWTLLNNGFRC